MRGSASSSRSTAARRGGARWCLDFRRTRPPSARRPRSKGAQAATDPVVRAGTNGLFYYAGVAFDRGEHKPSAIFVARFIDLNNRENGDPFGYVGTQQVAFSASSPELDKAALAVDIPRTRATCTLQAPQGDGTSMTQVVPAGNVYVAYAAFTGEGAGASSQIMFVRSTNCGETWSTPISIAPGTRLVQNPQIAVDPTSGAIYVSWRAFKSGTQDDAIFVAKSINGGAAFGKPVRVARSIRSTRARPHAVPQQRLPDDGDRRDRPRLHRLARSRLRDARGPTRSPATRASSSRHRRPGTTWTVPTAIQPTGVGHQLMPAMTFHGRQACGSSITTCGRTSRRSSGRTSTRRRFSERLSRRSDTRWTCLWRRPPRQRAGVHHGARLGLRERLLPGSTVEQQLQFNPPNLPMFRQGTAPFMGDYIDLAPAPPFVLSDDRHVGLQHAARTAARSRTRSGPTTATCGRRSTATGRTTRR